MMKAAAEVIAGAERSAGPSKVIVTSLLWMGFFRTGGRAEVGWRLGRRALEA